MEQATPITVQGTLTAEDLLRGAHARLVRSYVVLATLAALALGAALPLRSAALALCAVVLAVMIVALEASIRRRTRTHPQLGPIAIALSPGGLEVTLSRVAGRQTWDHFRSVRETADFFFLRSPTQIQVIPKRYFTQPDDLDDVRRLLTGHVGRGRAAVPAPAASGQPFSSQAAMLDVRGALTRADTLRVSLRRIRPILAVVVAIVAVELALFVVSRDLATLWWALATVAWLALILGQLAVKGRQLPPVRDITVTFLDDSLWIRTPSIESNQLWGYFRSVKETKNDFLLRNGRRTFQGLPKRLFAGPGQLAAARQIFAEKVLRG